MNIRFATASFIFFHLHVPFHKERKGLPVISYLEANILWRISFVSMILSSNLCLINHI